MGIFSIVYKVNLVTCTIWGRCRIVAGRREIRTMRVWLVPRLLFASSKKGPLLRFLSNACFSILSSSITFLVVRLPSTFRTFLPVEPTKDRRVEAAYWMTRGDWPIWNSSFCSELAARRWLTYEHNIIKEVSLFSFCSRLSPVYI
jgi:hypothetical protein